MWIVKLAISLEWRHNSVIIASQITSLTIVYSAVYSDAGHRKHQSSASLAFVRWIHRGPVNSPHKWPATRKMFPFDDVIIDNPVQFHSFHNSSIVCFPNNQLNISYLFSCGNVQIFDDISQLVPIQYKIIIKRGVIQTSLFPWWRLFPKVPAFYEAVHGDRVTSRSYEMEIIGSINYTTVGIPRC